MLKLLSYGCFYKTLIHKKVTPDFCKIGGGGSVSLYLAFVSGVSLVFISCMLINSLNSWDMFHRYNYY